MGPLLSHVFFAVGVNKGGYLTERLFKTDQWYLNFKYFHALI